MKSHELSEKLKLHKNAQIGLYCPTNETYYYIRHFDYLHRRIHLSRYKDSNYYTYNLLRQFLMKYTDPDDNIIMTCNGTRFELL